LLRAPRELISKSGEETPDDRGTLGLIGSSIGPSAGPETNFASVIRLELRWRGEGEARVTHRAIFATGRAKGSLGPPSLESRPDPAATFYGRLAVAANGRRLQLENPARAETLSRFIPLAIAAKTRAAPLPLALA